MWFLIILLTLFIDTIVFAVPILVYRFLIRGGEPIESHKKAVLINFAFFTGGMVALIIFNATAGAYEDDGYRFQIGVLDAAFWALDYFLLTFQGKKNNNPSKATPVDYLNKYHSSSPSKPVSEPVDYLAKYRYEDEDTGDLNDKYPSPDPEPEPDSFRRKEKEPTVSVDPKLLSLIDSMSAEELEDLERYAEFILRRKKGT